MFGLLFVFFSYLMYCSPLTSDDLEFYSLDFSGPADVWQYVLQYGNGRVLGNLGVLYLVHMPVVTALIKAFLITGIIFLAPAVLNIHNPIVYLFSFLLFTAIPAGLFGEVYCWTSGFQNYLPPVWITFVILYCIQKYDTASTHWIKRVCCFVIFFLGIAGQLYVEHATFLNVFLAASLILLRHRSDKNCLPAVIWLVSALAGALCMVLTPMIFYIEGNRTGNYRSFNLDGILQLIISCKNAFIFMATAFPFIGSLAASGFTAVTAWLTQTSRNQKQNSFLYYSSLICGSYALLNVLLDVDNWYGRFTTLKYILTGLFGFGPFVLWAITLYPIKQKELRNKIYGTLILAVMAMLPLLVVSPTPDRVVFLGYTCTVCSLLLFANFLAEMAGSKLTHIVKRSVQCICFTVVFLLSLTFTNIRHLDQMRYTHIQNELAANKTEIRIFRIPYDYVFWDSVEFFGRCYFNEQWNDITFYEVDFSGW